MFIFKKNTKRHWECVYKKYSSTEVGWYQAYPERSLKLIHDTGVATDSSIIDIGGGTSTLSRHLLEQGYKKVTVLDISGNAIEKAKSQLGEIESIGLKQMSQNIALRRNIISGKLLTASSIYSNIVNIAFLTF